MAYTMNTIPETTPLQEPRLPRQESRQPKKAIGMILAVSLLLGASMATIYAKAGAASLEVTGTYTKEWTCDNPSNPVDTAVYGQSSGPLSTGGLAVTLEGTVLSESGETSFEFGRSEHVTAELVPSDGVTVSDWAFGGLIGELGGLLPGVSGVLVSCNGGEPNPPVVNKETGYMPAMATYVAYDYAPLGETGQIIVTVFVGDKYYQSTFQVHTVTKDSGHDGATARAVGVTAALAGFAAVLLMG